MSEPMKEPESSNETTVEESAGVEVTTEPDDSAQPNAGSSDAKAVREARRAKSYREARILWAAALVLFVVTVLAPILWATLATMEARFVGFTLCALLIAVSLGPSLRWIKRYVFNNEKKTIASNNVKGKMAVFVPACECASNYVYGVVGEFESFFNNSQALKGLRHSLDNGARVEIITGDRGTSDFLGYLGQLIQGNFDFLRAFKKELLDGRVVLYYGPREDDHFYVVDSDTIIREHHPYKKPGPWRYRKHTAVLGNAYEMKFEDLRDLKTRIDFSEKDLERV